MITPITYDIGIKLDAALARVAELEAAIRRHIAAREGESGERPDITIAALYRIVRTSDSVSEEQKPCGRVFLLTVLKRDVDGDSGRDRTWAWYSRLEDAERDVLRNAGDMFEANYYDHAVIEEVPEYMMSVATVRGWYRASYGDDEEAPTVSKIEAPSWSAGICNWGIG